MVYRSLSLPSISSTNLQKTWTDKNNLDMFVKSDQVGHEPDMVYLPPPRGSFVDHNFLKAYCLRSILQHVSPLAVGALGGNSLL